MPCKHTRLDDTVVGRTVPPNEWEYIGTQFVPPGDGEPAEWLELRNCPVCGTTRAYMIPDATGRLLCPELEPEED